VPPAALESEEELGGGKREIGLDMGMKAVRGGETGSSNFSWGSFKSPSSSRTTSLDRLSAINDDIGFSLNGEAILLTSSVLQDSLPTPIFPSLNAEFCLGDFTLLLSFALALALKQAWQWNASLVLS